MFESTLVDNRSESHRSLTVAVSFLGQSVLILVALLIPLLTTQSLPTPAWMGVLLAPPPPFGAPPSPEPPQPVQAAAVVPQQFDETLLRAPTEIPADIALVVDNAGPPALANNLDIGIPGIGGSIGDPTGIATSIWGRRKVHPPPPPPPATLRKPTAPEFIRVSEGVQAARLMKKVAPVYPPLARQARIAGVVKLEAIIARDGSVRKLRATSGHPLLIPAAKEAVSHWRYHPTLLNGEPVEVFTQIEVRFVLR